jgi:hypothetical protein
MAEGVAIEKDIARYSTALRARKKYNPTSPWRATPSK